MLVVRHRLDNRQAIFNIGVQRFAIDFQEAATVDAMPIAAYRALLDTGAQRTCLTHRAIAAEGLNRHGKRLIKNVHNENLHSLFMVKLGFWCAGAEQANPQDRHESFYGLDDPVEVINIADNERFDAIVGMDVLGRFDFSFSKTGDFCIDIPG